AFPPLINEPVTSWTLHQLQLPQFDNLSDSDASEHIAVQPRRRRVRKSIKDKSELAPRVKLCVSTDFFLSIHLHNYFDLENTFLILMVLCSFYSASILDVGLASQAKQL